ncbi:MAG: carbohydrate ABC transporter permease [Candidatus Promineifilaceae bacterium]
MATIPLARPLAATRRRAAQSNGVKSFVVTFVTVAILAAFLSPLLRVGITAFKTDEQVTEPGAPMWPARPESFSYQGEEYDLYEVPTEDGLQRWALYEKGRQESLFLDPADPAAGPIAWQGSWRTLERAWVWAPAWDNFSQVWELIDYPRLLFNTFALAVLSSIGVLTSCILVAYGFARFRIPGKNILFLLLISTIFLPAAVTLIPTYTAFVKLGWVGTWLPLIVPTFFANAYDVFLLRQFFLTIPREMDEAAMIDGASPFRVLTAVILPQSWPAVIAVTLFHFVYSWNDFFGPLIYLSTRQDLQPISVGLARFNGIYGNEPTLIQAGTLMTLIVPVLLFIFAQRFLLQGVVLTGTGVEK